MEFRSPRTLSYLTLAGLGVMGVSKLLSALFGLAQAVAPTSAVDLGDGDEGFPLWLMAQGLIALIQLPTYIFTIIVFLMWLFRIYKNLPAVGAGSTEFTPGWAVGWWFIPLANLIKPFQAVRDAWLESDPDFEPESQIFSQVKGGAPTYMVFWWGFWIISNTFSNIATRGGSETGDTALDGYLFLIDGVLWVITSALAIHLVRDITARQEHRYTVIGTVAPNGPPPPPTFSQNDPQ
jgi:hypothetical protein